MINSKATQVRCCLGGKPRPSCGKKADGVVPKGRRKGKTASERWGRRQEDLENNTTCRLLEKLILPRHGICGGGQNCKELKGSENRKPGEPSAKKKTHVIVTVK